MLPIDIAKSSSRTRESNFWWIDGSVDCKLICLHNKCTAEAQLEVGQQYLAIDAAYDDMFFAPVELVCFARFESQRHEGFHNNSASVIPPESDEFGDAAVVTIKSQSLKPGKKFQGRAALFLWPSGIDLQHPQQPLGIRRNLIPGVLSTVLRFSTLLCLEPIPDRLPCQARAPLDFR